MLPRDEEPGARLDREYREAAAKALMARALSRGDRMMLANILDDDPALRRAWKARDVAAVVARLHALGAGHDGADMAARVRILGLQVDAGRIIGPMLRGRP